MANSYSVAIGARAGSGLTSIYANKPAPLGVLTHTRTLCIITDSAQSAMSIAKGRLNPGEEIMSVYFGDPDVIVDLQSVTAQS